jgi:hypothetical protein
VDGLLKSEGQRLTPKALPFLNRPAGRQNYYKCTLHNCKNKFPGFYFLLNFPDLTGFGIPWIFTSAELCALCYLWIQHLLGS